MNPLDPNVGIPLTIICCSLVLLFIGWGLYRLWFHDR